MASIINDKGNSSIERRFKVIAMGLFLGNIHRLLLLSLVRVGHSKEISCGGYFF